MIRFSYFWLDRDYKHDSMIKFEHKNVKSMATVGESMLRSSPLYEFSSVRVER